MPDQHRATPEQWGFIELYADSIDPAACILELRARIEALEAAQQPHQDKMDRLIAIDRDDPSNSPVERIATDTFRALCAELANAYQHELNKRGLGCALVQRARAALAQPEPVAPTDEELLSMRSWSCHGPTFDSDLVDFARAVLARWGTPANTINQEDYDRG